MTSKKISDVEVPLLSARERSFEETHKFEFSGNNNNNYNDSLEEGDNDDTYEEYNLDDPPSVMGTSTLNLNLPEEDDQYFTYKDIFFLFLFCANILIISAIALSYGGVALSNSGADYWIINPNGFIIDDPSYDSTGSKIFFGIFCAILFSGGLSTLWIYFLSQITGSMIYAIITILTIFTLVIGIGLFSVGYIILGICMMMLTLITIIVTFLFQTKIEFISMNIQIASEALISMPYLFSYAFGMVMIQITYILIWSIAVYGYATNNYDITTFYQGHVYYLNDCVTYRYSMNMNVTDSEIALTCPSTSSTCYACICDNTDIISTTKPCFVPHVDYFTFFLLLLSFIWTNTVFNNLLHYFISAAITNWWKYGSCDRITFVTGIVYPVKYAFGSICFGSLLTATIQTLRSILYVMVYCHQQTQQQQQQQQQRQGQQGQRYGASRNTNTPTAWSSFMTPMLSSSFPINPTTAATAATASIDSYQPHGWLHTCTIYLMTTLMTLLTLLNYLMKHYNRYAIYFIANYHVSYYTASQYAMKLLTTRQYFLLLHQDLLDYLLWIIQIVIGLLTTILMYYYAILQFNSLGVYIYLLMLIGFVIGYMISALMLSILLSAVVTVYISFAYHPSALKVKQPNILSNAIIC